MDNEIKKLEKEISENCKTQLIIQNSCKKVSPDSPKLFELYVELLGKMVEKQKENVDKLKKLLQSNKE